MGAHLITKKTFPRIQKRNEVNEIDSFKKKYYMEEQFQN
jgi:hypothetical protein